jgi:CheY-like chemotaxis protein
MTDPVSITGLLITVGHLVSTLYEYGKDVKQARSDINDLTTEVLVLRGILQQIEHLKPNVTVSIEPRKDPYDVLKSTKEFVELLLLKLEMPTSRVSKMLKYAKWPLDKDDVSNQLRRFERLKSLLILIFLTENSDSILSAIQSLQSDLDVSLRSMDDLLSRQEDEKLLAWLAPLSPDEEHRRISEARQPGTRKWFLNGPFTDWLNDQEPSIMWLTGKCE